MPMSVLNRVDLCVKMRPDSSKRGKFARQRNKMAANLDLFFRVHLHRQPNASTKLDLRSPIVDRDIKRLWFLFRVHYHLPFLRVKRSSID